jgi:hypothetical protein
MQSENEIIDQGINWVEIIDTVKWPILVLIVVLIFVKPIKNFLYRMTKIGYGDKALEATQQAVSKTRQEREHNVVDRALGLFRPETIESFSEMVKSESDISKLKDDGAKVERLLNYSTIIYIMKHFDNIYSNIFGSQIRLLETLNTLQPETKESLKFHFDSANKYHPNFYKNYSYDRYLKFLYYYNLIREDNGNIGITILGVDFLKYITETNKDVNKAF